LPEANAYTVQPFQGKTPPPGWVWCDGKYGTPDMNNMGLTMANGKPAKFIIKLATPLGSLMIYKKKPE
jgi:hypothetical protein